MTLEEEIIQILKKDASTHPPKAGTDEREKIRFVECLMTIAEAIDALRDEIKLGKRSRG